MYLDAGRREPKLTRARIQLPSEPDSLDAPQQAVAPDVPILRFTVGRFSDNELILFDRSAQESWIVYPPRSAYEFLRVRRASPRVTVVEHHPWTPFAVPVDHQLQVKEACALHGTGCAAYEVVRAAVSMGFDPFA